MAPAEPDSPRRPSRSRDHPARSAAERETERLWRLAGMGGTMASEIAAGALIGWVLDKVLGTSGRPWLIVGTVTGVVVGFATFIRSATIESRQAGREGDRVAARQRAEARAQAEARAREAREREKAAETDAPPDATEHE